LLEAMLKTVSVNWCKSWGLFACFTQNRRRWLARCYTAAVTESQSKSYQLSKCDSRR